MTARALLLAIKPAAGGGSATIALRSQSTIVYGTRGTTTVPAPAGIVNDDILLVSFFLLNSNPVTDPTPPAGFSTFGTTVSVVNGGLNGRLNVFWKRAASEAGSYDFTNSASSSTATWMGCLSGCKASGTPLGAESGNNGTTSTSTGTGITTTAANSWLMWFGFDWADTANNLTPPTGMTERHDAIVIYVASELIVAAGATGNRTMTNNATSSHPWGVRMVELLAA